MNCRLTLGLAALLVIAPGISGGAPAPQSPSNVLARTLIAVADDFIVDVYHNGVKIPDDRRTLLEQIHGATVEQISVDVRPGDWLVFNVVNNRMRWNGQSYFAVSARGDSGVAFATELDSGRWSCCDDPAQVGQFIADLDRFANHRALPIANPWADGDALMNRHADGWKGRPLWGGSRNTWIKYVVR